MSSGKIVVIFVVQASNRTGIDEDAGLKRFTAFQFWIEILPNPKSTALVISTWPALDTEVPLGNWSSLDVSFSADFRQGEVRDEAQEIFG